MNKTSDTMRRLGRCETPNDIGEYDAAAERLGRICPAVDDLGECFYTGAIQMSWIKNFETFSYETGLSLCNM